MKYSRRFGREALEEDVSIDQDPYPDRFRLAEIGCPEIDAQHREIERAVWEMADAVLLRPNNDDLLIHVRRLAKMLRAHFAHEEAVFERDGTPHLDGHRVDHARLLRETEALEQQLTRQQIASPMRALLGVSDQIAQHVYSFDMVYRTRTKD